MKKGLSFINIKTKAVILLLCVFFMMINTCPVRSLLTNSLNPSIEFVGENSKAENSKSFVYGNLQCSEGKVTKAALLDFSKSGNSGLPSPLFLTIISLYLYIQLSVLSLNLTSFQTERKRLLEGAMPLFLKNRSIII